MRTAVRAADADRKWGGQTTAMGPPNAQPRKPGGLEGRDCQWRRIGNCVRNA